MIGAYEMDGTALESLRTFGGVAHDEDGFSQAGGFFLDAAGVGEDDGGFLHQVDELEVLQGFDEEEVGAREIIAKHLVDGLAHIRVEVHGVDEVHIGIFLAEVLHSCDHADEAVAEVLSSVAGDQDEFFSVVKAGYVVTGVLEDMDLFIGKGLVALELFDNHVKGIDDGVARDEDLAMGLLIK